MECYALSHDNGILYNFIDHFQKIFKTCTQEKNTIQCDFSYSAIYQLVYTIESQFYETNIKVFIWTSHHFWVLVDNHSIWSLRYMTL